ncbi:hypothetical protein ANCCEY_13451, partial [Ancylostoma ceylanicum]
VFVEVLLKAVVMWIEVRRACEAVQNFTDIEDAAACAELIKEIEKYKWRLQNILKNQGKSPVERAKLKANAEIPIDGVKVTVDQSVCDETIIISDIFNLNEMDALELVLSGESQKIHFDCLNRGLIAVVCYYDVHRLLAVLLRTMLQWDKESMHESLRGFIEQNFVQRTMFQHLLQLQASFNVTSEFHMLSQPHVNGLGGPRHQNLLRNVIEEIRENGAEALYSLCEWGAEHANEFLTDIFPILKGVPLAEKFASHHLSAWICLVKLTSSNVLSQTTTAASVLSNLVKEIRNETVWSDQSVCGTVQLACAIALRALAVSPADHLNITNVEVDVDKVVDRAIKNLAMVFIRHGVIRCDSFKMCCTHVRVVDMMLKQLIALFPAKLMEIERNSEDELVWVDEMAEKGQQATPALHYENLLRCISDLYQIVDDPKASVALKECITELSMAYSSSGSDDDAAEVFLEERQWAVLDAALGVVSAPVPLPLKGALLRLVAALAKREASALRIWNSLNAHGLCTFAENGTLQGLQRELDERECAEEMFDTSLGFVHLLRSLLSHSHITIPEFAAPYLQYLTKSIVSQMASRSYKDIGHETVNIVISEQDGALSELEVEILPKEIRAITAGHLHVVVEHRLVFLGIERAD